MIRRSIGIAVNAAGGVGKNFSVLGGPRSGSSVLIAREANALAIDFLGNSYSINSSTGAETQLYNEGIGFSLDMTDNSYVVKN